MNKVTTIMDIQEENRELIKNKTPENLEKLESNNQLLRHYSKQIINAQLYASGIWLKGMKVILTIVIIGLIATYIILV